MHNFVHSIIYTYVHVYVAHTGNDLCYCQQEQIHNVHTYTYMYVHLHVRSIYILYMCNCTRIILETYHSSVYYIHSLPWSLMTLCNYVYTKMAVVYATS